MTKDYLCFKNWMDALRPHAKTGVHAFHVDEVPQMFSMYRRGIFGPLPVIVTSGGDTPIDEAAAKAIPPGVDHWFAANVHVSDPRIHPIPIGIPSDATYGDFSVIEEARAIPKDKELFACFCLGNNPPERVPAIEQAKLYTDWTVQCFQHNERKLMPHRTFIREMARHEFVLCPPGAQQSDTHRQWEALYLGCIPIVKRTVFNEYFATLFPMVVVDDWKEVTPRRLKFEWESLGIVQKDRLSLSYWVNKIKAAR